MPRWQWSFARALESRSSLSDRPSGSRALGLLILCSDLHGQRDSIHERSIYPPQARSHSFPLLSNLVQHETDVYCSHTCIDGSSHRNPLLHCVGAIPSLSPRSPPILFVLLYSLHETCTRASLSNKVSARVSGPPLLPSKNVNSSVSRTFILTTFPLALPSFQAATERHYAPMRDTLAHLHLVSMPQAPCLTFDRLPHLSNQVLL